MPIEFVPIAKMPLSKRNRKSKIESSPEWAELAKALKQGFSKDKSIHLILSDATKKLFKGGRAANAFLIRLRKQFGKDFQIRLIQGEIYVTKPSSHIGNPVLKAHTPEPSEGQE